MTANTVTRIRNLLFETPNGCCAVAFQTYFAISTFRGNTNLQLGSRSAALIFRTLGQLFTGIDCCLGQALLGEDCYRIGMSVFDAPTRAQKKLCRQRIHQFNGPSTYIDPKLQSERNITGTAGIHGTVAAQILRLAENRDCNAGGKSGKRKRGG
jgi:hypothetical protein